MDSAENFNTGILYADHTEDYSEDYSENLRKIWYNIQTITRKILGKLLGKFKNIFDLPLDKLENICYYIGVDKEQHT